MKTTILSLLIIAVLASCTSTSEKAESETSSEPSATVAKTPEFSLVPVWSTDSILLTPESAIYDEARNVIYVSNINQDPWEMDGNGFISKVNVEGKVTELNWVTNLNAPKGMGLIENSLYVTDNDAVVQIDVLTGEIKSRVTCSDVDAKLNDITVGKDNRIYVSGSESSKVYMLQADSLIVFSEGEYERPNGLLAEEDRLLILSFNGAAMSAINFESNEFIRLANGLGKADGIIKLSDKDGYITSSWSGQVFHISSDYTLTKLLDTEDEAIGAADIEYIAKEKLLLVPTFYDNRLMAYRVEVK
ncbi:MAG: ATP-binding protein [Bacteroidota bacterium]